MRVAEDAGVFKKYGLDFYLVYISSAGVVTAPCSVAAVM
jgi:hypothetical protein